MVVCIFLLSRRLPSREKFKACNVECEKFNSMGTRFKKIISQLIKFKRGKTEKHYFSRYINWSAGECRSIHLWGWESLTAFCIIFVHIRRESKKSFVLRKQSRTTTAIIRRIKTQCRAKNDYKSVKRTNAFCLSLIHNIYKFLNTIKTIISFLAFIPTKFSSRI